MKECHSCERLRVSLPDQELLAQARQDRSVEPTWSSPNCAKTSVRVKSAETHLPKTRQLVARLRLATAASIISFANVVSRLRSMCHHITRGMKIKLKLMRTKTLLCHRGSGMSTIPMINKIRAFAAHAHRLDFRFIFDVYARYRLGMIEVARQARFA